ncbi:hypothetical protein PAPYR_8886 [Paratrimastix pyriformis]|uniref:CN hydrolase domain-containing protein n=1 Tax=Paratrimastix pyriformis TaxID=342808 RepID=A0ABQ8U9R5_9EUKA|nr:hypothetical protein PAPYR_8886 [Paratrimastix pyriformis]
MGCLNHGAPRRQDGINYYWECQGVCHLMNTGIQLLLPIGAGIGSFFNFAYPSGVMTFLTLSATALIAIRGSWWTILFTCFSMVIGSTMTIMPYGQMPFGISVVLYAITFVFGTYIGPTISVKAVCGRENGAHPSVLFLFPCALVGFSHLGSLFLDLGQCGNIGLTAFRFRMLAEAIMPLLGVSGVTWIMSFAATVLAWTISRPSKQDKKLVKPFLRSALVLLVVLMCFAEGLEMRESGFSEDRRPTVRVASVLIDTRAHFSAAAHVQALEKLVKPNILYGGHYVSGPTNVSWGEIDHSQYYAQDRLDEAFEATRTAAATGARLILWSEEAADVFEMEDDADAIAAAWKDRPPARQPTLMTKDLLFRRASEFARAEHVSLLVAFTDYMVSRADPRVVLNITNKAAFFDPKGQLRVEFAKRHPVPFLENIISPGKAPFPVVSLPASDWLPPGYRHHFTPDLRVGICICYDIMYPGDVTSLGRQKPDLVISPSWDWKALSPTNSRQVSLRTTLENGFALARATSAGGVASFNPFGEQVALTDYFAYPHRPGLPVSPGAETLANAPLITVPRLFPFIYPALNFLCLGVTLVTLGLAYLRPDGMAGRKDI